MIEITSIFVKLYWYQIVKYKKHFELRSNQLNRKNTNKGEGWESLFKLSNVSLMTKSKMFMIGYDVPFILEIKWFVFWF